MDNIHKFQDLLKSLKFMTLNDLSQRFVLHFGEMGSHWGINRTVGQIYALLFISEAPLNAEQIAETLLFSRSNVSMGLKELQSWQLVKLQHLPGDRREYFSAPDDVWQIFQTLAEQRKKREIDPTLTLLRDAILQPVDGSDAKFAQRRMREMHDLIELLMVWFQDVRTMDQDRLVALMKLGSRVSKVLDASARFGSKNKGTS